jgi:alkanesulfonate monooxygenase SsuD/methylene tetrahydromethanopterin reductase-like flavin-dependent oxidoreductase (luciferase family)
VPNSDAPAAVPFAPGSVSFRLYPHNDLPATEVVRELCAQGAGALGIGFDGVMTSEHHGGFAGYMATPLQVAGFVLEDSAVGWAAACPLLLPLRATVSIAEEVAWLRARHPGRVGLGVAAGALPLDFEVMEVPLEEAVVRFKRELPRIIDLLRGEDLGPLAGDPALQACAADPVPVLSAAVSPAAARRAARYGAGILMEGMSGLDRLVRLCSEYDEAGGSAGKVLIRRVWLGEPPGALIEQQRRVYNSYGESATLFGDDQTVATHDPVEMAERLVELVTATGADALNLRVHLPGVSPEAVRDQIDRLGGELLEPLRARWPAPPTPRAV